MKSIKIIILFVLCVGCITQKTNTNTTQNNNIWILKNVNLFTGNRYIENTNLIFDEAKIIEITNDLSEYNNASIIDGTDKTIIPPLANAHVHLYSANQLKESLNAGIFVNFDMHSTDEIANELREYNDSLLYSRIYSSNAAATVPGGHGTQFGIIVPTINDSISPTKFVQDRIKAKADYIKVIKEPMLNTLTDQQALEVIQEAHKNNLLAVGHSHKIAISETLINQGIDGLMHIWFDKEADLGLIEKMKDEDVFLVPTLLVTLKVLEMGKQQGWAKYVMDKKRLLNEVKRLHDNGVIILCGTDPPNFNLNYSTDLFEELLLLSEAGLTNQEVLRTATINIYKAFTISDYGELRAGSTPNFILIDGNPIKDLKEIKNDKVIYKNGKKI